MLQVWTPGFRAYPPSSFCNCYRIVNYANSNVNLIWVWVPPLHLSHSETWFEIFIWWVRAMVSPPKPVDWARFAFSTLTKTCVLFVFNSQWGKNITEFDALDYLSGNKIHTLPHTVHHIFVNSPLEFLKAWPSPSTSLVLYIVHVYKLIQERV